MTVWLLIIATHQGGNIAMRPIATLPTVTACADSGRVLQREAGARGQHAATLCQEVRR